MSIPLADAFVSAFESGLFESVFLLGSVLQRLRVVDLLGVRVVNLLRIVVRYLRLS